MGEINSEIDKNKKITIFPGGLWLRLPPSEINNLRKHPPYTRRKNRKGLPYRNGRKPVN